MKTRKCPACHGLGGEVDVILDDGTGPFETCGYCKGKGEIKGNWFYHVLGYQSGYKRYLKKRMMERATASK
jgi:hypothetical protein